MPNEKLNNKILPLRGGCRLVPVVSRNYSDVDERKKNNIKRYFPFN